MTADGSTDFCDTDRTDQTRDGLDWDGTGLDRIASAHRGWVAGTNSGGIGVLDRVRHETSSGSGESAMSFLDTCASFPVWCC